MINSDLVLTSVFIIAAVTVGLHFNLTGGALPAVKTCTSPTDVKQSTSAVRPTAIRTAVYSHIHIIIYRY